MTEPSDRNFTLEPTVQEEPAVQTPAPAECAAEASPSAAIKTGGDDFMAEMAGLTTVGRYEIIRMVGQGAAGVVFLGKDPYIKRFVAIKVSRPASELSRESFFIEAQSAGRLNHPNIVSIYDFGLHGEYCYITMEYVDGTSLDKFCNRRNLLPVSKVVEVLFSVCYGLDHAHKQGIIHRDIKPSNILLDKSGPTKITDFGIAQTGEEKADGFIIGTPYYIAPERLIGRTAGVESDIFSLGCVMYELLTGEKAFPGESLLDVTLRVRDKDPAPPRLLRPELPESLVKITAKALAKDPNDRYQNCMDLAYALRVALRGLTETVKGARDFFDYIRNVPFFHNFTKDQVRELVTASNIVWFRRGTIIITEGEVDDTFFVILSGKVKVFKDDRLLAIIKAGECFGEMAFISNQARVATVKADTDCSLMKISSTLLNRSPESVQLLFFQNFAKTLARRLGESSQK
ncbi:MAG: serine/threonine-protein kinase [Thermodesulfobacteriota bacterium]